MITIMVQTLLLYLALEGFKAIRFCQVRVKSKTLINGCFSTTNIG